MGLNLWASRIINKRTNTCEYQAGRNVIISHNVVYSYRLSFPIAVYLGDIHERSVFLVNNDQYSTSTTTHRYKVVDAIKTADGIILETCFSLLEWFVEPTTLTLSSLVHFKPNEEDDNYIDFVMNLPVKSFQSDQLYSVLFSKVGHTYTADVLSTNVDSVETARYTMFPPEVKYAFEKGDNVKIHGDFYFIPLVDKFIDIDEPLSLANWAAHVGMKPYQLTKDFAPKVLHSSSGDNIGIRLKMNREKNLCYGVVAYVNKHGLASKLYKNINLKNILHNVYYKKCLLTYVAISRI